MTSRFNGISFLFGVAALAAVMIWNGTQRDAVQADQAFNQALGKIAVVDIERITNEYLDLKGSLDELREKYSAKRRGLDQQQQQIRAMQEESEVFPKDSERFLEIQTQIAIKIGELKVQRESLEESQNRDKAKLTAEVYEKSRQTISDYAQEKGLDLVFLRQGGQLKGMRMEDVSSNILVRSVIWNRDDLDITQAILERMN
jgi:Skp family chaperone for outer membrane proteins